MREVDVRLIDATEDNVVDSVEEQSVWEDRLWVDRHQIIFSRTKILKYNDACERPENNAWPEGCQLSEMAQSSTLRSSIHGHPSGEIGEL
mgnify:CR=1 FL=1